MTSTRHFPPKPESVSAARHFVRQVLHECEPDLIDAAELMVSELATNAVLHARSDFEITVETAGRRVRVGVRDSGHGAPRKRSPEPREHSGRGLRVVDALAARWGVTRQTQGKLVWFILQAPDQVQIPAPDAATQPEPRRGSDAEDPDDAAVGPTETARARPRSRFMAFAVGRHRREPRSCRYTDSSVLGKGRKITLGLPVPTHS
jgi:anti-sigma regulatory factor (Ser/Thr protein kinase)